MKICLIFDAETSGLPKFGNKSSYKGDQPWIVQISAILCSEDKILSELNTIIAPNGRKIDPKAEKTHGISAKFADEFGLNEETVADMFCEMLTIPDLAVGHNIDFDLLLVSSLLYRNNMEEAAEFLNSDDFEKFCTMKKSTNLCKIPNPRRSGFKWPTLIELHNFLFGEKFDSAHSASADTHATMRCYYEMLKRGIK
jgi:DNA polymerase-3 subunit alpha